VTNKSDQSSTGATGGTKRKRSSDDDVDNDLDDDHDEEGGGNDDHDSPEGSNIALGKNSSSILSKHGDAMLQEAAIKHRGNIVIIFPFCI
jgi:hypothetical protein